MPTARRSGCSCSIYGVGTIGHGVSVERCDRRRADAGRRRRGAGPRRPKQPLPYLLICAFIANAASFVLPISNPANLVIYGSHMPPLLQWLPRYLLPSARLDRRNLCCCCAGRSDARCVKALPQECRCPTCRPAARSPRPALRRPRSCCSPRRRWTSSLACRPAIAGAGHGRRRAAVSSRRRTWSVRERHFLGRAAAGRRPVRAGRSTERDRPDRIDQRAAARGRGAFGGGRGLGRRHRRRLWQQPHEQSAGRP